jgi:DNA-binding CsgD family transcriptional regulator
MAEQTGSPKELASKLDISIRTVYNYIAFMKKEMKAPITYDFQRLSYVYEEECEFNFNAVEK